MLNYPKRNIAQTPKKKPPRKKIVVVPPNPPAKSKKKPQPAPGTAWCDILYPADLWNLYNDLDKITYQNLSVKERNEILERLPSSLAQAEDYADKKLFEFVQNALNTRGTQKYADILRKAMTANSQELLALRSFVAATSGYRARDTIKIYSNRPMNSQDFFPESCIGTMTDPKTGEQVPFVQDRPEGEDDAYWRAGSHSSTKHRMVRQIATDRKQTNRDKLPPTMADQMAALLAQMGVNVTSHEDAWKVLSEKSRRSPIEDRIVARIAYLIMNATVHHDKLSGPSHKALPKP